MIGGNSKPHHEEKCSESKNLFTVLWVGIAEGVNFPVIFLTKDTKVHQRLRDNNFVTKNGLPKGSCVITNKSAYMDENTWVKLVTVVASSNRKLAVRNIAFVCCILFSTYLTIYLCT